ncbi:alcohol dehydrogenase catalytic domain-containing protein [Pseudonocardia sp. GCM10023141]|uniref:alcohol dehydrogenase catalytic domain-containing protein n=1 Tax=Pseudonocardia sp. GCM10023141 TaxID=3252653 RepID=UPI003608AC85
MTAVRAVVVERFGTPDVLVPAELPDPVPGPGEVRVRVQAVAVARTKDVATRAGKPPFAPAVTFPHVFGTEHAGVVDARGPGVPTDLLGRRVAVSAVLGCGECRACRTAREEACPQLRLVGVHRQGSYAEFCVVPAANVHPIPDDLDVAEAAALAANGPVARAQLDAGGVGPGSTVLVIGAGGALGSAAAALAAFRGADVIGLEQLATKPGSLDGLPLHAGLDGDRPDLADALLELTGDWGIDCVIDNLGFAGLWERYWPALADMGRIVVSGAIGGEPIPVRLAPLYLHSQSLLGVRTGNRAQTAALWEDVRAGFRLPPSLVTVLHLEQVAAAHTLIEEGGNRGQVVVTVG